MAETFTYANLPNNFYNTQLDADRAAYWTGERQQQQVDLNKLYQDKFNLLKTERANWWETAQLDAQQRKQLQNQAMGTIKGVMGAGNPATQHNMWGLKHSKFGQRSLNLKPTGKKTLWEDPTQVGAKWWNPQSLQTQASLAGTGINQGAGLPTQKWLTPDQMIANSDFAGTSTFKVNQSGMVKNPNYVSPFVQGSNWAANSAIGKLGTWGAGAPSSIAGIGGALISHFGSDNDPTTHTGTERLGTGLSWGSTGWKLGAMIHPVVGVIAGIGAAIWGNRLAQDKADKLAAQVAEQKEKWYDKITEFRRDMRKTNYIGGTKGADYNWWNTNLSGART